MHQIDPTVFGIKGQGTVIFRESAVGTWRAFQPDDLPFLCASDKVVVGKEGQFFGERFKALAMGIQQLLGFLVRQATSVSDEIAQGDEFLFRLVFTTSQRR
jgi:hypothetical protein